MLSEEEKNKLQNVMCVCAKKQDGKKICIPFTFDFKLLWKKFTLQGRNRSGEVGTKTMLLELLQ